MIIPLIAPKIAFYHFQTFFFNFHLRRFHDIFSPVHYRVLKCLLDIYFEIGNTSIILNYAHIERSSSETGFLRHQFYDY
jgi:hypothetical protein